MSNEMTDQEFPDPTPEQEAVLRQRLAETVQMIKAAPFDLSTMPPAMFPMLTQMVVPMLVKSSEVMDAIIVLHVEGILIDKEKRARSFAHSRQLADVIIDAIDEPQSTIDFVRGLHRATADAMLAAADLKIETLAAAGTPWQPPEDAAERYEVIKSARPEGQP